MTDNFRRAGLIAAIALTVTAACGRNSSKAGAIDDGLQHDLAQAGASGLELAPKVGRQVVVSAIEGGPQTAPAPASRHTSRPAQQPRRQAAASRRAAAAAPAPLRQRVEAEAPTPQPSPTPRPAVQPRQPGVYSTEADVFRQMPWIRP